MLIYSDPDVPIKTKFDQVFAISLELVPSTGYTWVAEYDLTMLELLKPPTFTPDSSAIGGGAVEIFEFKTKQVGKTQIKMMYKREWEPQPRDVKIFQVNCTETDNN